MSILNIKDPVAHDLAVRLAERTGTPLTQAVIQALREQLLRTEEPAKPIPKKNIGGCWPMWTALQSRPSIKGRPTRSSAITLTGCQRNGPRHLGFSGRARARARIRNYIWAIARDPRRFMSAVSYLETLIIMTSKKPQTGRNAVDGFLQRFAVDIIPFTKAQAVAAAIAHERFGKGRHPAALNFGDCASFGLAIERSEPLLFKGDNFSKTDLTRVPID